jgi:acyl-CoA dehydrogenase
MSTIEFSEERSMLLETAMEFCANQSPITAVRARIEEPLGFDTAQWQEMAELGWLGVAIPETYGGLGLSLGDVVPIVESMGRNLMGTPYFATTMAIQALVRNGTEDQKQTWLPRLSAGTVGTVALVEEDGDWNLCNVAVTAELSNGSYALSGSKYFVLDAEVADLLIVSVSVDGTPRLALVEKSQLNESAIVREVVIDETRRSYQVDLSGVTVEQDQLLQEADFQSLERTALLLLGAEMAGGLAGVLNVIIEYLNTRKAFDKYIGSFQALKHPTVDILIGMEASRSHIYHAATALDVGDDSEIEIALRMAKAHSSQAFAFAGDRAVQFHGGFGFTYECDAQLFLRRALWCQYQFGDERHHRQMLAPLLLD